jgi:hypothetical protein
MMAKFFFILEVGTGEEFASKLAAESTGATVVLAIPVKAEHMQNDNSGVLPREIPRRP